MHASPTRRTAFTGQGLAERPTVGGRDALGPLTFYTVVLVGVPAQLIVQPLGAPGTPAGILAAAALLWWALRRMLPAERTAWGFQPVRLAVGVLGLAVLASYLVASLGPLATDQRTAADRGLIAVVGWLGITFLASDMLSTTGSVNRLLRRVSIAAAVLALVGVLQFLWGLDLAALVRIPGLVSNDEVQFIGQRSDFRRVAGTAAHPIEFGVVLAVIFPVALHLAITDKDRPLWSRWGVAAAIGVALPMSVSRSAVLGLFSGILVLFFSWSGVRRLVLVVAAPVALVALRFAVPGLLGTIVSLFTAIGTDPSIQGRTEDYAAVGRFVSDAPLFGRGFKTFLPDSYRYLDNQYLGSLIETGAVGVLALVGVFVVGFACARGVARHGLDTATRDLGVALAASVAVLAVSFVTFDGFGFSMVTGLMFLVLGCIGALWRLTGGQDRLPIRLASATGSDHAGRHQGPRGPSAR